MQGARGLVPSEALRAKEGHYRRWGLSPRPENVDRRKRPGDSIKIGRLRSVKQVFEFHTGAPPQTSVAVNTRRPLGPTAQNPSTQQDARPDST